MIYFTADTHFGHGKIIDYSLRPFADMDEHDQTLIANWNEAVCPEDEVYILGDFIFTRNREDVEKMARRLHGRKYLILGNHDRPELCPGFFEWVKDYYVLEAHGLKWVLFHFPLLIWWKQAKTVHLYGHVHNKAENMNSPLQRQYQFLATQERCFNVGVDVNGFAPVSAEFLVRRLQPTMVTQTTADEAVKPGLTARGAE
jgi:calcineurin-like phosphoesterase family protein